MGKPCNRRQFVKSHNPYYKSCENPYHVVCCHQCCYLCCARNNTDGNKLMIIFQLYYRDILLSGSRTTCHFTLPQIRNLTSPFNPQTQTETSNSHVNEDLGGRGGCNEGETVLTIWDTPNNSTAC